MSHGSDAIRVTLPYVDAETNKRFQEALYGPSTQLPDFDGKTYERAKDHKRLSSQLFQVKWLMGDGKWRSLDQISTTLGFREQSSFPPASISARLRDLRKEKFGAYQVERRRGDGGLFEYRLVGNTEGRVKP